MTSTRGSSFTATVRMIKKTRILYGNHGIDEIGRNFGNGFQDASFDEKLTEGLPVIRMDACNQAGLVFMESV